MRKICLTPAVNLSHLTCITFLFLFTLLMSYLLRYKARNIIDEHDQMLKVFKEKYGQITATTGFKMIKSVYSAPRETGSRNFADTLNVGIHEQDDNEDGSIKKEDLKKNYEPNIIGDHLQQLTKNTPANITDIVGQPFIKFDTTYKNPCFIGDESNPMFNDKRLHCLPYFYLIGVKKSGTSDLFQRIAAHPEFVDAGFKEAQWFPRIRSGISTRAIEKRKPFQDSVKKGIDNRSIKFYISMFDDAAVDIQKCLFDNDGKTVYHNCITAEATPANLHMHTGWTMLPGNEGLTEPRYTNFHYLKHITPNAKIIIIFRDPVTRLFSDYLHCLRMRKDNPIPPSSEVVETFHRLTSQLISAYETCFIRFSMRRCIYNETLSEHLLEGDSLLTDSFRAGFYAFYMEELLSVFRKEQIFAIHMSQYLTDTEQTLADTFEYLDMRPLSPKKMLQILKLKTANIAKFNLTMYSKTRDMLYTFYKPYNEKMAELMTDKRYLFTKV